jgi:predicted DNA-binding transcriptional regulator YafY
MRQKRPLIRYKIINRCLRSPVKRYWQKEEILKKLEEHDLKVDLRTLSRDLEDMRYDELLGFNAPINFCRRNGGYFYADENYSIDLHFGPRELEALRVLIEFLKSV